MLTGQAGGRLLGVIVLIYILCFGIFQSPKIFDYYRVSDDTRQQIYPLYLARDGQLFQDDLLTRYFRSHTPPFYYYAHYPLAWLIDPVILSKIMQFLLLGVVLRFLYLIGKLVYGPLLGWTLVFLTVHSPALVGLTDGGLPRGWAAPGTVVFVWAVLADRQRIALAAVLVSGLFYPPIFLVLGPSYAVWTLVRGKASRWDVVGLVLIILGFWPMVFRDPEIGRVVTLAEAELMPEWQVGSRFPFLPMPSLLSLFSRNFVTSYLPSPGHAFWTWLLVALGISALLWARPPLGAPRRLAAALGLPLGFSVVMFEVSRLMAFRLHIPDRNLKYTVPCLGMVLITIAVFEIVTRISCKWRPFRWSGLAAVIVIGGSLVLGGSGFSGNLNLWANQRFAREFYEFVEGLPKDALFAGPPMEMDNLPLFSRRKVYVSDEAMQPLYDRYYSEIRRRLQLMFRAYYATNLQVVEEFREETGVDFMVVRKEDFTSRFDRERYYFQPYNDYIISLKGNRPAQEFIFADPPGEAVVYEDRIFRVVDLSRLL